MTERESRHAVRIPARLRADDGWAEVSIRNVSSHGMMLLIADPPPRGSYIEVRCERSAIVGRVMWVAAGRCGLRTKERISVAALTFAEDAEVGASQPRPAKARLHRPDAAAERSALIGRRLQFAAALAFLLVAGGLVARASHEVLARPSEAITRALS